MCIKTVSNAQLK